MVEDPIGTYCYQLRYRIQRSNCAHRKQLRVNKREDYSLRSYVFIDSWTYESPPLQINFDTKNLETSNLPSNKQFCRPPVPSVPVRRTSIQRILQCTERIMSVQVLPERSLYQSLLVPSMWHVTMEKWIGQLLPIAVQAEISVTSPTRLSIYIIHKNVKGVEVSQRDLDRF